MVRSRIKKIDWPLVVAVLLLVTVGLLSIYSVSQKGEKKIFERQLIYVVLGFFLFFIFALFDYRIFRDNNFVLLGLYFFGVALLVGVLLFGREIRGASSWFRIGQWGFEPVELMKVVVILVLAKYFSLRHIEVYRLRNLIISGLYIIIPLVLILLQPELGYALIMILVWLAVVIVAGIRLKHIFLLVLIGVIVFSVSWFFLLQDYQKERVISFINPHADPLGEGYHVIQSIIAIGSGKLFGRGLGYGTQSQLDFLPEQHTDFIFATIAEEWGFLGSVFILVLFGLLLYRLIKISLTSSNNFARLFSIGLAAMFLFQAVINIGMNMGLLPIVGIPLPFVSYGGSSMVMGFIALGIIQSIAVREK